MPSGCVVPSCVTNKYSTGKRSTFQVPTDENLRAKWIASIPGVESLRSTQRVCEKHFEEHFILKEFIKYDNSGKIIAQVPFKRARLQQGAVPTIFQQSPSKSRSPQKVVEVRVKNYTDYSYALQEPSTSSHSRATVGCELVNTPTTSNCDTNNVATQSLDEFGDYEQILSNNNECLSDSDVHCHLDSSAMEIELPYEESNVTKDNIEAPMHTNSACSFTTVTFDSVKFNFNAQPGDDTLANDCFLELPKPWNVCKLTMEKEEVFLFTYVVTANDRGTEKHIFEKTLIITSSREIKYEIYMTPADITGTKLPRVLNNISMLPDILQKFKDMRVCKGITSIGLECVPENTSLKVCAGADWRHADCKMLSKNREVQFL
ncbi:uncharacterized protein LOC112459099 isoform X2 [Temnothorax curvispinosus]|uniref:Uncharacterized protein LOC112459099 isoform X2 n=1 Tax=Temnothorax curvispinosus TaxID=300111 RepID=A0A6J1QDN6_9HYME|nr:uncharacterized protein LOC112459099 isoform X2 [Temnothorax curvispinosus]